MKTTANRGVGPFRLACVPAKAHRGRLERSRWEGVDVEDGHVGGQPWVELVHDRAALCKNEGAAV